MKKILSFVLITVLLISVSSMTVFAYGGRGNGFGNRTDGQNVQQSQNIQQQDTRQSRFAICNFADCDVLGPHQHDGIWYCSQTYLRDGLGLCTVQDCAIRGIHEHDGVYYHCAYYGTGLGCGRGAGGGRGMGIRLRDGSCLFW